MKRPVLIILIYYLAGILAGRYLSDIGIVPFAFVLILPVIAFVFKREKVLLFAPVFMVLGFALTTAALKEVTIVEGEMNVEGVVYEITYSQNGTQRLDIKTDDGMVVRIMSDKDYNADAGDVIAVKGRAVLADKPTNPGEFDDYTYLRRENIDFRLYAEKIYKTSERNMYLNSLFFNVKSVLNDSIDRIYTEDNSALVKAVVTGDKSFISESLRTLYTEGGAIHILCVSGLHVGVIIAALSYFIKRILKIKGAAAEMIIDFALALYMIFIGLTASVVRAVLMAVLVSSAPKIGRKSDGLNNIYVAALIILLASPLTLFNSGFLLSFATVYGIVLSAKYIKVEGKGRYVKSLLVSSLFATIFALPITAYYFYSVSLAGIITNLVILPLTPIVVIGGILSSVVGIFFEGAGTFLAGCVATVLWIYKTVLSLASEVEFLNIITGRPPVYLCVIYYACVILLTTMKEIKVKNFVLPIGLGAAFVVIFFNNRILFKNIEIAFLDVGQGDCAVISDYSGNTFVVDTGGSWIYDEEDNTGVRFVYPYLQYKGENRIDVLFISHPDSDHALGCIGLLDKCDVGKIVFADFDYDESKLYNRIIEKAAETKTDVEFVSAGDIINFGDISFECVYPYEDSTGDDNSGSMVLKFTYGDFSALFTGDLGKEQEEILVENNADISADVLKVAHHGSKYSTSEEFVDAVGFSDAVISVGENNTYGHPHKEVLETLSGKNVYATDECGAVIIKTNGEKYRIKTVK